MMEIQMYNVGLGECFLLGQGDERIAVNCGTRNKKINGRDSAGTGSLKAFRRWSCPGKRHGFWKRRRKIRIY